MPTRLTHLVVDTPNAEALAAWWAAALGYFVAESDPEESYIVPSAGEPGVPIVFGGGGDDVKQGKNRVHLDLASTSVEDQQAIVARLLDSGATRLDLGQGDVPWTVLADPEGNELCALEPRDAYAGTGPVAAIVVDAVDPVAMGRFWAELAAWPVVATHDDFVALRAASGTGPYLEFARTGEPHRYKNRWHLDVAGYPDDDRDAEVARAETLGAKRIEIGQSEADPGEVTWVVLADPEENEFCILRSR